MAAKRNWIDMEQSYVTVAANRQQTTRLRNNRNNTEGDHSLVCCHRCQPAADSVNLYWQHSGVWSAPVCMLLTFLEPVYRRQHSAACLHCVRLQGVRTVDVATRTAPR